MFSSREWRGYRYVWGAIFGVAFLAWEGATDKAPRVNDPWHQNRAGRIVDVLGASHEAGTTMAATHYFAFSDLCKSLKARDQEGLKQMAERGLAVFLERGTRARLLEEHDYRTIDQHHGWEVRVLDGKHKDKSLFIRDAELGRLIEVPVALGKTGSLRPLKIGEPVPVFTNAFACQNFIEAYRRKDQDEVGFLNLVNQLRKENTLLLVKEGRAARLDDIVSINDDILMVRDPEDPAETKLFLIPGCLAK